MIDISRQYWRSLMLPLAPCENVMRLDPWLRPNLETQCSTRTSAWPYNGRHWWLWLCHYGVVWRLWNVMPASFSSPPFLSSPVLLFSLPQASSLQILIVLLLQTSLSPCPLVLSDSTDSQSNMAAVQQPPKLWYMPCVLLRHSQPSALSYVYSKSKTACWVLISNLLRK